MLSLHPGVPYMREADEAWWRGKRKESEEPSNEELNKFLGFSQVFRMIADSVSWGWGRGWSISTKH